MIGMAEGCTTNSGTTTLIQKSLGKCSRLYASLNRSTYQLNQGEMMVENAKRPEKGRSKNNLAERAGFEPALGYYPKHAFQARYFYYRILLCCNGFSWIRCNINSNP